MFGLWFLVMSVRENADSQLDERELDSVARSAELMMLNKSSIHRLVN